MTPRDLELILDGLDDGFEMIFLTDEARALERADPLLIAWRGAEAEARRRYGAWRARGGADAYAAYRAAADRADAAQDSLTAQHIPPRGAAT